jgi:hypothetical protein
VKDEDTLLDGGVKEQSAKRPRPSVQWLRSRYEGSPVQDLIKGLGAVEFGNWIIVFGASFLLSVLPLILLLGALANSRVDNNIAARLGLGREGSHIIDTLFIYEGAQFVKQSRPEGTGPSLPGWH